MNPSRLGIALILLSMSVVIPACSQERCREISIRLGRPATALQRVDLQVDGSAVMMEDLPAVLRQTKYTAGKVKIIVQIEVPEEVYYFHVSAVLAGCARANLPEATLITGPKRVSVDTAAFWALAGDAKVGQALVMRATEQGTTVAVAGRPPMDIALVTTLLKSFRAKSQVAVAPGAAVTIREVVAVIHAMEAANLKPILGPAPP